MKRNVQTTDGRHYVRILFSKHSPAVTS